MVAHMNDEALRKTIASGEAWYFSRSRQGAVAQGRELRPHPARGRDADGLRSGRDLDPGRADRRGLPHRPPLVLLPRGRRRAMAARNCRLSMRTGCSIPTRFIASRFNFDPCVERECATSTFVASVGAICKSSFSSSRWGCADEAPLFDWYLRNCVALPVVAPAQAQTAERAPDTMAARVLACASCHGADGEGTSDVYFPRLAGKPAGYSTTSWWHSGTGGANTRR